MLILDLPVDSRNEERFLRGCNILYHLIFNELQLCCMRAKIPFLKICEQLQYPVETINTSISEGYKKRKNTKTPSTSKKKKTRPVRIQPSPIFNKSKTPEISDIFSGYFSEEHSKKLSDLFYKRKNPYFWYVYLIDYKFILINDLCRYIDFAK